MSMARWNRNITVQNLRIKTTTRWYLTSVGCEQMSCDSRVIFSFSRSVIVAHNLSALPVTVWDAIVGGLKGLCDTLTWRAAWWNCASCSWNGFLNEAVARRYLKRLALAEGGRGLMGHRSVLKRNLWIVLYRALADFMQTSKCSRLWCQAAEDAHPWFRYFL